MTMQAVSTESSNLLQQMTQSLMEGIAISDRRGRLVFANRALEQLLGYEPGELVGRSWTVLFPDKRCWRTESWMEGNRQNLTSRYEASLLRKDGSTVPVVVSSRPLSDDDRDPVILSTFSDLREQPHPSGQTPPLVKPEAMGEQVASIIHELSNSLTIVFLQAQMLSKNRRLSPPVEQNLTVIRDQARLMMEMVSDLRATADPHQIRPKPIDVNKLVEQTLDLQMEQLEAEGIQVHRALQGGLPIVKADPHKIQQVLVNLINNARQAMAAQPEPRALTIATQSIRDRDDAPQSIQIRVQDSGPGIQSQVLPLIFEPFFTTRSGQGMGLGLSICEQIVEKHGGKLRAENNAAGGATFVLELPVAELDNGGKHPRPERGSGPRQTAGKEGREAQARILIVDDEPAVAVTVGRILQDEGFEVAAATEAQQALTLLEEMQIDLIVSDMKMPRMDGEKFWQAVRERDPGLADRIIFATGDTSAQRAQAFLQRRGCAWIEKPFNPEELLRLIHETLPSMAA